MYTFKCLLRNGENTRVYDGRRFRVDLPLSDSGFFICSVDRNSMMPWHKFLLLSTLLQLYRFIIAVCELKKGIAVNYLFIAIYTNCTNTQQQQQKEEEKEKKHYHDINIVIREMIFFSFFSPRPSHFPGMNKVYCYCCFDSISSRTDAF